MTSNKRIDMYQYTNKHRNSIDLYRQRMHFSLKQVARLLGHQDGSALSAYERGQRLPSLTNALRLGIILRIPVEFLFPSLYDAMKKDIRAAEQEVSKPEQLGLLKREDLNEHS